MDLEVTLQRYDSIIGVDEVGCGALAGPIVACALVLRPGTKRISGIMDSKKLSPRRREELSSQIWKQASVVEFGRSTVLEVEQLNAQKATKLAAKRAVEAVLKVELRNPVLITDFFTIQVDLPQINMANADENVYIVSCASILAKVHRDRLMRRLGRQFPRYDFQHNVGYCSSKHRNALKRFGITKHHRRTCSIVQQYERKLTTR